MEQKIIIDSKTLNNEQITDLLSPVEHATLTTGAAQTGTRFGDTSVVTALVSSVLGFIVSLLGIYKKKDGAEITIIGKSGWQIKVPAGTSHEDINKYINAAEERDIDSITI
jgi:hypothetical protein